MLKYAINRTSRSTINQRHLSAYTINIFQGGICYNYLCHGIKNWNTTIWLVKSQYPFLQCPYIKISVDKFSLNSAGNLTYVTKYVTYTNVDYFLLMHVEKLVIKNKCYLKLIKIRFSYSRQDDFLRQIRITGFL